jgi:glutamyl endopeptidase
MPGLVEGTARFEGERYVPAPVFGTRHRPPAGLRDPGELVFSEPGSGKPIGRDDRRAVGVATNRPFRHVCALKMEARDGTPMCGTGWMIGPRTVVTAGHCLFVRRIGAGGEVLHNPHEGWVRSVTVIPALAGSDEPFGHAVASRFAVTQEWEEAGDADADVGVIFLDDDRFARVGWFAFGAARPEHLRGLPLNIVGYPLDRDGGARQYFAGRIVDDIRGARLMYTTDTYAGQSGSPIWLTLAGERVVVGVHTRTYHHLWMNSGVRIEEKMFAQLRRWKQEG